MYDSMKYVTLREISKCSIEQQKIVRNVRNQLSVRNSMYTGHKITFNEHLEWLEKLKTDKKQIVFLVLLNEDVVGVVSLSALDILHKKSDWAFFLDEKVRGGLGVALEFVLINYAFYDLDLKKLNCEVIETNPTVVKMHKSFGFKEEGFKRSNVEKNGKRIGVHLLGLTKEDWETKKHALENISSNIFAKFDLTLEKP